MGSQKPGSRLSELSPFYSLRRPPTPGALLRSQRSSGSRRQRSVNVTKHGTIPYDMYGFLLVSYSNFVRKTHHFWDIRLQRCRDLENRVKGPWRSL